MKKRLYRIVVSKDEETGYFIAEVPTLSPCITYGESFEEAIEMVQEAIEGVVASRLANGYPVPDDNETLQQTAIQTLMPIHLISA